MLANANDGGSSTPIVIDSSTEDNKTETSTIASSPSPQKKHCKKKQGKDDEDTNLEFTWICTECREAECFDDADAPLLLCDGKCNRPFHPPCANLASLPPDDEPWLCRDCVQEHHQCTVCKEYGRDDVDLFCCDAKGCGLFFHENCLSMYNVNVEIEEEVGDGGINECEDGSVPPSKIKFRCPAHECWTCSGGPPPTMCRPALVGEDLEDESPKKKSGKNSKKRKSGGSTSISTMWSAKKERLFRCLDCPISYHITCMPPSCSFHELALLCHEHAYTSKLPYLDAQYSLQASVEADAEKKITQMKRREERRAAAKARGELNSDDESSEEEPNNPFLPGLVGTLPTFEEEQLAEYLRNDDADGGGDEDAGRKKRKRNQFQYCLPVDLKDEVYSKPPQYTHTNINRYDPQNRPRRHPPSGESCSCKVSLEEGVKSCGDRCFNRLNYTECVGDKSLKNGDKNPYLNCNCGKTCGNRSMSKRQFAKCRPAREHGKGWGLITVDGCKAGDLVQEYAGEIIDELTKEERLRTWTREHPNDPNFYVMHLEPGWYIDAREIANMARFINHSCDPNCKLVPVNVSGHMRVGIYALKDIEPGQFLCYDYQFDTQHGERFTCRCGAANCRGTMKGGKTDDEKAAEKKTKKELLAEAKARVQRDKKYLQSVLSSERERLDLTGPFVPGEEKEKAEMVAAGPNERCRREAQESRVFLWRNAVVGGDFSSKYWRSMSAHKGGKKRKPNLASVRDELGIVDVISTIKE